jgi:Protein of unknown function (DUF4019)
MMLRRVLALVLVLLAAGGAQAMSTAERNALNVAEKWLVFVDDGRYAEAWPRSAASFKAKVSRQEWRDGARELRQPYGRMVQRKAEKIAFISAEAPAGDGAEPLKTGATVAIIFATKFAGDKTVNEEVTVEYEKDGIWRVAGYFIR